MVRKDIILYAPYVLLVFTILFFLFGVKRDVTATKGHFISFMEDMENDGVCKSKFGINKYFNSDSGECDHCEMTCNTEESVTKNSLICFTACKEFILLQKNAETMKRMRGEIIKTLESEIASEVDKAKPDKEELTRELREKLLRLEENAQQSEEGIGIVSQLVDDVSKNHLSLNENLLGDLLETKSAYHKRMKALEDEVLNIQTHEILQLLGVIFSYVLICIIVVVLLWDSFKARLMGNRKIM